MQFTVEKKALVKMIKTVNRRDAGSVSIRNKNQWMRIAAQNGTLELMANGFSAGGPATVAEEGVAFVWYGRMLEIVQSYNTPEITITITPAGMTINTFETGRAAWFAIFDKLAVFLLYSFCAFQEIAPYSRYISAPQSVHRQTGSLKDISHPPTTSLPSSKAFCIARVRSG